MFKSIRAYINRIRTSLFGRMERMKESSKRMAFERKRKTLRRFLRNGLRVENLEGRALMAVDMNVISSPMAITMNAANDTATISRLPAATPYPASLMVQTNTADPDQDPDVTGDETYTFIRTAGTGTNGITVSDVGSNAGQVLTIGGDLAISNPKGTDRAIASFTATGIETINLDQAINVSGSVSGNADTVNVDDPGKVAQAVSLVKAAGAVNIDAGAYSDGEVTVGKEGLTVAVSADVSGVSLKLGSGINNITLTGAGDMNVTGNSNNNTITANAGANVIDGGAGVDQVVYNVAGDTYESFVVGYDGTTITLTKGGKVDSITNVESIQFTNKTLRVVPSGGSIQGAVDAAAANDVLLIAAGSFNENVTISKVLTVFGANAGKAGADNARGSETVILGKLTMTAAATVDGVLLTKPSNSSDTGSGINFTNWNGINAVIGNGSVLKNSIVEAFGAHGGFGGSGFVNMTAGGATLESSLVRAGSGYNAAGDARGVASVVVSAAGSFVIDGNTLRVSTNNADAVNIPAGTSVTVTDNIISGVDGGIVAYAAFGGLTITGNNVNSYNDNGIRVFNHTGANPTVVTIANNAVSGANPLLVDTSAALQYVIGGASAVSLTTTTQLSGILADNTISTLKAERYVSWAPQDFVMDSVTVKAAYVGDASDNSLTGTSANELFVGGLGTNTIDGGAGTDRASYIGSYAEYTVSFNGSTVTVTGTGLSDTLNNIESIKFADKMVWVVPAGGSIQGVVDAATAGDVLLISTGTFTGNVTVNKALSILGPFANVVGTDNSRSAVAGTGEATIVGMFKVSSSGSVTISGLRFLNNASSGIGGPSNPALQRQAASAGGVHTYSNNIFYSTESAGDNNTGDRAISFEVLGSGSTTVSGNYITGNGTTSDKYGSARWNRGIWSDGGGSSSITISNNTIEYARSAMTIDVAGDATYTITNNTARISGTGISFGINAASSTGNITGMVVDNVDTDFNFQNLSQAVTFSLATALSNTVPSTETVVVLGGSAGDTLTGSSTVDYFTPNAGADTVNLAGGNDFVTVSSGSHVTGDSLDGGDGSDTIYFTSSTASDTLVLPAGTSNFESALISNGTGATTGTTALSLDASAVTGALSIQGNDGDNTLKGGAGADTITANAGNDVIQGNAGNDTIDGGAGTDSAVFSGNYSDYTIAFSGSNVTVSGPDGSDTVTNVDKLTFADRSVYIVNGAGSTITTISAAITAASAGDVVMVAAGTYSENLTITKSLTLRGAQAGVAATGAARDGGETIINGTAASSSYVITVEANDVTIDGLAINPRNPARDGINTRVVAASTKPGDASIAYRAGITIRNNWIYSSYSATSQMNGILFGESSDNATKSVSAEIANVSITGNYINLVSSATTGGPRGVVLTNMFRDGSASLQYKNITISDNTVYATNQPLLQPQLRTTLDAVTITGNTFGNSRSGVSIASTMTNSTFNNNTIQDVSAGSGVWLSLVNSTASGNTIRRIGGSAFVVSGGKSTDPTYYAASTNSTISNNSITYNDVVLPTGSTSVTGLNVQPNLDSSASSVAGTTGVDANTITLSGNTFVNGNFDSSIAAAAVAQRSVGKTLNLVNATPNVFDGITLDGSTTTADLFAIADKVADYVDASNLGSVTLSLGNVYVTPNSFWSPSSTTIADVQRAVTLAGSGSTVWVKAGAYDAVSATTSVDNLTLNTEDGVTGFIGLVLDNSVTNGTATLAGAGDVNLTGNAGDNTLTGNDGDNSIKGGLGDDTIDGGAGSNTAVFTGNYSDYAITLGATVEVDGPDGTDSLTNIQFLQFDDITIPVEVVSTTATISAAAITYGSSATITVTIARESGAPLPGGTVSLVVGTADPIEAQLDANGVATFTVPGLAAGSYDLAAAYAAQGIFGASSDTETLTVNTKTLTVSGATATNRAYDGTLIVSVAGGTLVGIVDDDDVSLTSGGTGTGTMADKHVGTGKAVTVTGYTLTGAAASNYSIDQPTDVTVDISTKTLTVSDAVATDRVYNATTTVVVSGGSLEGIVDGDEVSLVSGGSGTGTMEDKNVGTDKSVTVIGYAIEGTGASNYSLTQPTGVTVDISAKTITVSGADATDRVYDATTTVSVSGGSLVGVETDDVVNLSASGTGEMIDKNVGTGKSVTVTGYSISGDDSGNYLLTQPTGVDVNITAKTLTVSDADATDRVYNASTTVDVSGGTLVGVETGDAVDLSASGTGTMTDKNVGTGKSVTVTGYSISGDDSGNYLLTQPTGVDVNITAKTLTVSGADATDRVYNATTTVDVSGGTLVGVESGDSVDLDNVGTGEMSDKNVGTGKSVTVSGYSISGTDAANYSLDQPTGVNVDISVKTITVSGTEATDRVYDATTAVSVSGGSLVGVESGDIVNLSDSDGTGAMADKNVGTGKSVTVSGYSISGTDSGNYSLTQPTGVTVDISTKSLTGTFTADNKQYDGTTAATVLTRTANQISGDDVSLDGGTATFNNKNVGTGKIVTLTGATLSGADAANYTIGSVTDTNANVTAISLTGAFTVSATKVYDGNTSATVVTRTIPTGVLSGETVTLVGGTAAYSNRHVADGKTVSLSGASLGGVDSGNYILDSVTDTTANITKKDVTGSFTVDQRQYDGTNVAIVASTSITKENNDDVVLLNFVGTGDAATFNNAFVGNGKLVTPKSPVAGNWSLSGAEAGNYNLTAMNTTTANITKRTLTPTVTVNNRVYNGTTAATINTITSDKLELDDVTVTATSAAFNDKNVGVGKAATVSGLSLSGSSASQYELASTTASATGTVTKAPLTLNFLVTATKVYDGTDTANITASNLTPPVFGDDAVGITGVVAKYDSKNVGANKPVTIADGYSLTGADAGNYEVTAFSPRTASITAKSLSVTSWAVDNKVYDGTNAATISSGTVFAGLVSGDTVTLGGTATFANKNAGDGKVVTLASPSLTGADGGNYSLSGSVGTVTANITKKTLTPVYSVVDKYFDGNNVATVTLQSDDRISGDALTISYVSATFADSAIGANKDVTISTISVSGTDSGNYELNATSQTLTASINNNPPVVTTSSGNTPYFLGNVTVIDAAIVVDDFESTYAVSQDPNSPLSLGGGSMTISVTENQGADDYLLISPQGSDAGQIGIDEGTSEVTYGGVVIGTYAGGYEEPLVITFGSAANLQSVQALARRIAFSNSNMETTIEARTVSFVVNDGVDSSDAATKSVTINASNQPPVLTPSAGSTNFTEGSGNTITAPVRVDNAMTVSDSDQLNFDTGVLTVSLGATGTADDRLNIISSNSIGTINVSGGSVRIVTGNNPSLTTVEIGTFTGGTGSDPLVVTLTAEATVARTQLLVRAVGFQNVSNAPSTDARSVEFQLSDGAGATSTPVTKTVTVTATNDLPVVVLSDSTPTFTESTGPTTDAEALPVAELIDNGVSISDPDNPASFDGGNVTATIVFGGIATSDRFGIRQIGGITVSGADAGVESVNAVATATVSHDGVVFGTISLPTNAVRITFNSEATLERVEALARALTVRNTSDLPGSIRLLRVQVTDNASGTSAFVTKTVTVVSTNDIPRIAGAATTSLNLPRTASSATNALGGGVTSFVDSFVNGAPSDMNGGTLTASMKKDGNSSANVQLSILAGTGITLSGNDIIHTSGGVATTFGTITSTNPVSGGELTIIFNANANGTRITALLKQLRVRAVAGATTGGHELTVTLTEPDTDTVSVTRPFNVT